MEKNFICLENIDALKTKLEMEVVELKGEPEHFDRMETPIMHRERGRASRRSRRKATFAVNAKRKKLYASYFPYANKTWRDISRKDWHFSEAASKKDFLNKKESILKIKDTKLRKKYVGLYEGDELRENLANIFDEQVEVPEESAEDFAERMIVNTLFNKLLAIDECNASLGRLIFALNEQYGSEKANHYLAMAKDLITSGEIPKGETA